LTIDRDIPGGRAERRFSENMSRIFRTEKCEAEEERPGLEVLSFSVSQKTSKKRLRGA
jgi:hypothetical protein